MTYIIENFLYTGLDIELTEDNYQFILNFMENRNTTIFSVRNGITIYKSYSSDFVQIVELGFSSANPTDTNIHNLTFSKFKQECQRIKALIRLYTIDKMKFPLNLLDIKGAVLPAYQHYIIELDRNTALEFGKLVDGIAIDNVEERLPISINIDNYTLLNISYAKKECGDSVIININGHKVNIWAHELGTVRKIFSTYKQFCDAVVTLTERND